MSQPLTSVLRYVRQVLDPQSAGEPTDGQLLERFAAHQDEAAFESLLRRHGPMVHNLCRGMLRDAHLADDAFQATFLVLARKANSIKKQQSVACWLYGVAYRIALRAKANAARQRWHERQVLAMPYAEPSSDLERQELCSVLTEELQRLPEKYRAPLVLCYLEGRTVETAARELGWPQGSMGKRLARGRDLLRERLAYRGLALSSAGLGAVLAEQTASAALPAALVSTTLKAALLYAAGPAAPGAIAAPVAALADGALPSMTSKLKILTALVLLLGLAGGGLALLAERDGAPPSPAPVRLPDDPKAVVVCLDLIEGAAAKEPYLTIRADGAAVFGNPRGDSRRVEGRLSAAELQDLLRFALREQDFFQCDSDKLAAALRGANETGGPLMSLRICADGREHEVRCRNVTESQAHQHVEVKQLASLWATRQRLERVVMELQAGGREGIAEAVRLANVQVRQQLPEAPLLTSQDLQSARLHPDGRCELVLERRGVAANKDPFSFVYARIDRPAQGRPQVTVKGDLALAVPAAKPDKPYHQRKIDVEPKPIASDPAVKYDYDIVYVRAPRQSDKEPSFWADVFQPYRMEPGADLMLLHPDGSEEVLVGVKPHEAIVDPFVSFDGESVYYAKFHDAKNDKGADLFKIHVPTRKMVQLTNQEYTPNVAGEKERRPVYNLGPTPAPGGKIVFTSTRNGFHGANAGYAASQLFVMDDPPVVPPSEGGTTGGWNVECIGHLNLASALHPTILKDGRIMFSSLESQGLRSSLEWGIWSIHPDGANWGPMLSAFHTNTFHFQTQLSDGAIVVEGYYQSNNFGFGSYLKFPVQPPDGYPAFGPAYRSDPRNPLVPTVGYLPFSPHGIEALTLFAPTEDTVARLSDPGDPKSPRAGKVTHPSGAPDNHLLTAWTIGPVNRQNVLHQPLPDSGIYLMKHGKAIEGPGQMLLIKNDPKYNEQWPRALVPYRRIYGVTEPARLAAVRNDGRQCPHLPAGTPYGLVGTSSLYKRESFPDGVVPKGSVTAVYSGGKDPWRGLDPFNSTHYQNGSRFNWGTQGADAGWYTNDDVHAIRILVMEPTSYRSGRFYNHARERLRILGEIPVRKFSRVPKGSAAEQPLDPDGNPDTSFLAKIPADTAFTFQTLDKNGMVLNMAQTWHQLRPGEIRHDCGGCHAHSQKPTEFKLTAAAKPDYPVFDLTAKTPLLVRKDRDESKQKWDVQDETGLRYAPVVHNVEYHRDIKPILARSCTACHTQKSAKPAAGLVLDDDAVTAHYWRGIPLNVPGTYVRLALDEGAKYGPKPIARGGRWTTHNASRYVRMFQSRRSLLAWKVLGRRTDGAANDDFPTELVAGDPSTLHWKGQPIPNTPQNRDLADLDYTGVAMPPPEAVAGTYDGPDGRKIKVEPLTDEERRTIIRWIDLGCPIDQEFNVAKPDARGNGWLFDDQRPTLTLADPKAGVNEPQTRILIGMSDHGSGLDLASFQVVADFALEGAAPNTDLAPKFKEKGHGVFELRLATPLRELPRGKLTISVKDKQGNQSRIERTFSVGAAS